MNLPRPMKARDFSKEWQKWGDSGDSDYHPIMLSFHRIEPKVDGVRAFLVTEDETTRLVIATSGTEITHDLPQMQGMEKMFPELLVDGELVIPGETLGTIVGALNASKRRSILDRAVFYAFDILRFRGKRTEVYYVEGENFNRRRELLEGLAEFFPTGVRIVSQYPVDEVYIDAIRKAGFEGFVLKNKYGGYAPGRSENWLKVKWTSTIDCFVTGWEPGRGSNEGRVGSLVLSVYDHDGNEVEIGKHGVFPDKFRESITAADGTLEPSVYGQVHEVTYQSVGTDMRLRHPRLLRTRPDKTATECTIDQLKEQRSARATA